MTAAKKPRPRKGRTVVRWLNLIGNGVYPFLFTTKRSARLCAWNTQETVRVTISLPLRGDEKK